DDLAAALGTRNAQRQTARALAFREGRAAQEPAVAAPALHHWRAAQLALVVGDLRPGIAFVALTAFTRHRARVLAVRVAIAADERSVAAPALAQRFAACRELLADQLGLGPPLAQARADS